MLEDSEIKVCLVCVCYNAHADTRRFLDSVQLAFSRFNHLELTVVVVDNSTNGLGVKELGIDERYEFSIQYLKNSNTGYFPAFSFAMSSCGDGSERYDYVMISNVDLTLQEDFFFELSSIVFNKRVGIIAPRIISLNHGSDANPKILSRPTKRKLTALRFLFSSTFLHSLYSALSVLKARNKDNARHDADVADEGLFMYAPHGAFIIFTTAYFRAGASIDYPRFLFGEEVFVAEEARDHNLLVQYQPSLKITDREHGSTSLERSKFISGEHVKSYKYLIAKYFDQSS